MPSITSQLLPLQLESPRRRNKLKLSSVTLTRTMPLPRLNHTNQLYLLSQSSSSSPTLNQFNSHIKLQSPSRCLKPNLQPSILLLLLLPSRLQLSLNLRASTSLKIAKRAAARKTTCLLGRRNNKQRSLSLPLRLNRMQRLGDRRSQSSCSASSSLLYRSLPRKRISLPPRKGKRRWHSWTIQMMTTRKTSSSRGQDRKLSPPRSPSPWQLPPRPHQCRPNRQQRKEETRQGKRSLYSILTRMKTTELAQISQV